MDDKGEGKAKGQTPARDKPSSKTSKNYTVKELDFAEDSQHQLRQREALEPGLERREQQLQLELARQP